MVLHRTMGPFDTTAIGLGEMPLTIENNLGPNMGVETIHAALDAGCRQIDTAWAYYCSGGEEQTGEKLVRDAMASWSGPKDEVLIATKVGHYRNFTDGKPTWAVDGSPENLIRRAKESALALGVDTIDLLYFHRPDPRIPYGESIEAIKQLVDEGVAREAGVSNASIEQMDIAQEILGNKLIAVQNQFSPIYTETADTLEHAARIGISFVCWSPLGGFRKPKDESKFDPFRAIADKRGVSYQQVVLAWELAKGDHVFVIPGAHRPATILDSLKAGDLELTPEELATLGRPPLPEVGSAAPACTLVACDQTSFQTRSTGTGRQSARPHDRRGLRRRRRLLRRQGLWHALGAAQPEPRRLHARRALCA